MRAKPVSLEKMPAPCGVVNIYQDTNGNYFAAVEFVTSVEPQSNMLWCTRTYTTSQEVLNEIKDHPWMP